MYEGFSTFNFADSCFNYFFYFIKKYFQKLNSKFRLPISLRQRNWREKVSVKLTKNVEKCEEMQERRPSNKISDTVFPVKEAEVQAEF